MGINQNETKYLETHVYFSSSHLIQLVLHLIQSLSFVEFFQMHFCFFWHSNPSELLQSLFTFSGHNTTKPESINGPWWWLVVYAYNKDKEASYSMQNSAVTHLQSEGSSLQSEQKVCSVQYEKHIIIFKWVIAVVVWGRVRTKQDVDVDLKPEAGLVT